MTTDDPFDRAVGRDRQIRDDHRRRQRRSALTIHIAVYVAVQILLASTWLLTTPDGFPWFVFPLLGWGIGLAAHAAAVYSGSNDAAWH